MSALDLRRKLEILADSAKYDASCASSGGSKKNSRGGKGIGAVTGRSGVCHAYTPDGRCVSLLKILLTNFCVFDCVYCVNRVSSNIERARFSVAEVVALTLDFYKRNYIEGLFLSSGVIRSADETQELLNEVARSLRIDHDFRGYIHLKLIAGASAELAEAAGRHADRVSVNIELPSDESLRALAPEKTPAAIRASMGRVRIGIEAARETTLGKRRAPPFAPAGQSTQMIVGADASLDLDVMGRAHALYAAYGLKRVYYSAFSPIPDSSKLLPSKPPHLMREHRLYQADWLMRCYGFTREEVGQATRDGMFDLDLDPKVTFAMARRELFPVDLNKADLELLLRVPGLGVRSVKKLVQLRRHKRIILEDVRRLTGSLRRIKAFIVCEDYRPGKLTEASDLEVQLRALIPGASRQLDLF